MAFTYTTLAQAQDDVASRLYESLGDATRTFWTATEITKYITEALRCWNAYTSFWRAEFSFSLQQGVWWYDIPSRAGSLRPYTVTDGDIVQMIEYHILEPITASYPLTWLGSTQFSLHDILDNVTQAQNQTIGTSGCTIMRTLVNAPIVKQRIFLSQDVTSIRRVAWLPVSTYQNVPLRQNDMFAKRAYDFGWTVAASAPPRTWIQSTEPPPSFDVDRVPPVPGNYDVLSVNAGATANSSAAQTLSVPDDWSWLVKWNALENLMGREGVAKDAMRQDYCQQRFDQGVKLLAESPAVLALQLNGVPMFVDAVRNGDDFSPGWQNRAQGTPNACYAAGLNLLGFPQPDANPYSALVSVVQNAPVPVSAGDYIQVAKEDYSTIMDYAQHIATFKMGGSEFSKTLPLYANFVQRAGLYNAKIKEMGFYEQVMEQISQLESERNPVRRMA